MNIAPWIQPVMIWVIMPILVTAVVLTFIRLVRGPSLPARIVALDMLSAIGVAIICAYSVMSEQAVLLDVALVVSLITFLGTVGFAYYINRT